MAGRDDVTMSGDLRVRGRRAAARVAPGRVPLSGAISAIAAHFVGEGARSPLTGACSGAVRRETAHRMDAGFSRKLEETAVSGSSSSSAVQQAPAPSQ
ncbi:hypothetical protein GCM10022244_38770 [Streptomyces gulbargensis]|uniref:Uncharacterized protein n=1 Tax=Streptomyces gulbargensis TaxID=364901 RepID=A0ABP7ML49_9ACTN